MIFFRCASRHKHGLNEPPGPAPRTDQMGTPEKAGSRLPLVTASAHNRHSLMLRAARGGENASYCGGECFHSKAILGAKNPFFDAACWPIQSPSCRGPQR